MHLNRVRPPVVGQCTTAFMRLLDSPSKKKAEPSISFGVAAKLLTKMKKTRPKCAGLGVSRRAAVGLRQRHRGLVHQGCQET